jgi:hypothetical protein
VNLTPPAGVEEPDETNEFGRYTPECQPTGEDELYAVILALVEQSCSTGSGGDLDSWALSAFERAIEALAGVGFVQIETTGGRLFARLLPKARKFEAWMEIHDRRKRIAEARHMLATVPGLTPEVPARVYRVTVDELIDEAAESRGRTE